jgi:predicted ATPase
VILTDRWEYVFLQYLGGCKLMTKRIVVTGGPGTGKTVLIQMLETLGYPCYHEIIRELTQEAIKSEDAVNQKINPLAFVSDPYAFNTKILEGRVAQFHNATELQSPIVFYDRGIPDVMAYMEYFGQHIDKSFSTPGQNLRYDTVILLPPWKEIYKQDHERLENFGQACDLHENIENQYIKLGYSPIILETGNPEFRLQRLLEHLNLNHEF